MRSKTISRVRLLALLLSVFAAPVNLLACDICGCYMGVTPYDNQSSIMLLHRYRMFNGYPGMGGRGFVPNTGYLAARPLNQAGVGHQHDLNAGEHDHVKSKDDFELFRTIELRGQWFVHPRVEVIGIVPMQSNSMAYGGDEPSHMTSLGDVNVLAGYHVLRSIMDKPLQQRLVLGGGIKLPTGKFYVTDRNGFRYPLLNQPGTGSTDFLFYTRYSAAWRWYGITANALYRANTTNYYGERMGNGSSIFMNWFVRRQLGDWIVLPAFQHYFEHTNGEFFQGENTGNHRMTAWLAGPGVDAFYKNWGLHVGAKWPVYQVFNNHPENALQLIAGVSFNVNQDKFLFKGRY